MFSVVVTGFRKHGPYLAGLLNERAGVRAAYYSDSKNDLVRAVLHAMRADAAIVLGGPHPKELVRKVCAIRKRPVILIWAGSDVQTLSGDHQLSEYLRLSNVVHWACAPHLVEELAPLGIQARCVPIAAALVPEQMTPFPRSFKVLTYLPEPRRAFYGQAQVWEAARALSDVAFVVVGKGTREEGAPPNVHYLGEVSDMERRIDECCALLRLTEHDGLARGIVEALARGRHAIWRYTFPGVIQASSASQAIDALRILHQQYRHGRLALNEAGAQHVRDAYNPNAIAGGILAALHDATEQSGSPRDEPGKFRLAVSGTNAFSTRVAENARHSPAALSLTLLSAKNTSETAVSLLSLLASDAWYSIGEPVGARAFELAARVMRKRRVVHWLGGEIEALREQAPLLRRLRTGRFTHLAQTDQVRLRLREFGLHARVAPLAAVAMAGGVVPLPQRFTLLLYVPRDDPQFYGRFQYERLMKALPPEQVRYRIVGGGRLDVPPGIDAEDVTWSHDLSNVYANATALIRFAAPGATSSMVIEALLHGRYVLCAHDFPFVTKVATYRDLERTIFSLLDAHSAGTLVPQFDAARAMADRYGPERCLNLLAEACGARA